MKLMMVIDWTRTDFESIASKFASGEDANPPEGVTMISRWHDISAKKAWVVIDADDASKVQAWTGAWADYRDWETHVIVDDEEVGPIIEKLLSK